MLPEPTTRLERSHLRLTFNRSMSEPGHTIMTTNNGQSNGGSLSAGQELHERQHQKRLYLQLQHHHNQVHLHQHGGKASSVASSQSSVSSCSTSSSICSIDKDELDEEQSEQSQQLVQSPAKRCCLGLPLSVSLPSSPSSESSSLQRAMMAKRTRIYTADQLASKLSSSPTTNGPVVVVDCRPFMAYNASHVRNAINLNCSDRWNRKRLQTGRVSLADLATSPEGKDLLRRRTVKEVIVYDEGAVDCERLPPSSTLYIVLSALLDDHKEPLLLAGESSFQPCPTFKLFPYWPPPAISVRLSLSPSHTNHGFKTVYVIDIRHSTIRNGVVLCVCLYRGGYRGEGLFWAALYDTRRRVGERVDDSRSRKRHSLTTHTHTPFSPMR